MRRQAIAVLRIVLLEGGDVRAVCKEDVGAPVAVVIEDCDAAGHGFRRVAAGSFIVLQPKRERLELKPNLARRLRGINEEEAGGREYAAYDRCGEANDFVHSGRRA